MRTHEKPARRCVAAPLPPNRCAFSCHPQVPRCCRVKWIPCAAHAGSPAAGRSGMPTCSAKCAVRCERVGGLIDFISPATIVCCTTWQLRKRLCMGAEGRLDAAVPAPLLMPIIWAPFTAQKRRCGRSALRVSLLRSDFTPFDLHISARWRTGESAHSTRSVSSISWQQHIAAWRSHH